MSYPTLPTLPNTAPKMILTAGLPGAGKSTYLRNAGITLPCVDPDKIKEGFAGYDPKQPQVFHNESKKIARSQHLTHLHLRQSFIVDGTGTNVDKYVAYIQEAQSVGYVVELHYVRVKLATSLSRNASRERNVPNEVIFEKANVIETTTRLIGSLCDTFITIDND